MSMTIQSADRGIPQPPNAQTAPQPAAAAPGATTRVELPAKSRDAASEAAHKSRVASDQKRQELQEAVERLNEQMRKQGQNLAFTIDDALDRTVITVKNSHTGEVVRQIPDETMLRVAHSIEEFKGLFHNEKT